MTEIARAQRGNNRMETARAFAKCEAFRFCSLHDIIMTIRSYEKCGWLIYTDTEAILLHDCEA